jgi:SAM-dependent methyltransferase
MRRRWAAALAAALMFLGTAQAQEEVPFITTPDAVTLAMLQLAGVTAADRVVDLGSGDGRIVITAAKRFGARGLGVEIVPDLVEQSRANARKAGVADRAEFRVQDLFELDLRGFSVITMYLLPAVNLQLRPALLRLPPGTRIVSHDWDMGDWAPDQSLTLDVPDKAIGREKKSTLHLWRVPADVAGRWCGASGELLITQRFQQFSATLLRPGLPAPLMVFDGRVHTMDLRSTPADLILQGGELRVTRVAPDALHLERAAFSRQACPSSP